MSEEQKEKTEIPLVYKPFFEKVNDRRGQISTVHYEKSLEVQKRVVKKHGGFGRIVKKSVFQVRAGIDYENIKVVKEGHESYTTVHQTM